jgi:hypothetical protein
VLAPDLPAGIEQRDELAGFDVESANFTPFVTITLEASPG